MKSTVENLNPTKVKITVEVPYEEFKPEMDKVFKEYSKQMNIPGFRRGRAPARVIESYVGRGAVIEDAVNHAMPEYYGQAVEENKLAPLGKPAIEVSDTPNVEGNAGGDLKFSVEVEIRPEVKLPEFSGMELEVDPVEVKAEDVEEELTALRRRFASLKSVERAVKDEDFVTIDVVTKQGDEEIDNMTQVSYRVGSGGILDGLDDALKGLKAGEVKEFKTQLKSGPHGGEEALANVVLGSVKEQVLPELDDEFAVMVSDHDTIDDFRKEMEETVTKQKRAEQALDARDKLVQKLVGDLEFPLPEGVVEDTLATQVREEDSDEEKQRVRELVEKDLKTQIILDTLAEQRQMNVTQDELLQFILQTAQTYGMDPSMLLSSAEQNNRIPAFIQEIARNKAIATALSEVTVKDTKGQELDLSEFIGLDEDGDADADGDAAQSAETEEA